MTKVIEPTRVLITVMTYPHPSKNYTELVCTAGVTESGEWVRLYPIDYRYRPTYQRFHKYQWVELELEPRGGKNDPRKESRKPCLETIRILGEPIPPDGDWRKRREIIDRVEERTVAELERLYDAEKVSLGLVRPDEVMDLEIRPADPEWKPEWQAVLQQHNLFEGAPKELRKLPYSFHYVFRCKDDPKPRRAMIEDWELGTLFLKESARLGSDEAAAQSVKAKYLTQICSAGRDTRFYMGTRFPYNTWLVLGVFWPPKDRALPLFDATL